MKNIDEIILNLMNQNTDARIGGLLIQHQAEAITENNKRVHPERPSQETKTIEFLKSPTEIERVWPLAAEGREHIANIFNKLELPIDLSVREDQDHINWS